MTVHTDGAALIYSITLLIILTLGEPDLLDALVAGIGGGDMAEIAEVND